MRPAPHAVYAPVQTAPVQDEAPPMCKLTVASGGCGAVERAGSLHFSFDPLHRAGPDL